MKRTAGAPDGSKSGAAVCLVSAFGALYTREVFR
jgi:hypothetical protein